MICGRAQGLAAIVAAWGLSAAPALAQRLASGSPAPFPWWRWFAAIGLCLGLAVAGALALRARLGGAGGVAWPSALPSLRAGAAARRRRVSVLDSVRVSPTLEVCLIRCDAEDYLLAATPHAIVRLSAAAAPEEGAP